MLNFLESNVLISNAYAQAAGGVSGDLMGNLTGLLPIILMFVVLWFMMIRPQIEEGQGTEVDGRPRSPKGDEVLNRRAALPDASPRSVKTI